MIIVLESKNGNIVKEQIKANDLDLVAAKRRFDSPLFTVIRVEEDKNGTLSNEKARQIIANEGIGYAVQHYISGDEFSDPETARLWNEADTALYNLQEYLEYDAWGDD